MAFDLSEHEVNRVMAALPPEARLALNTMAQLQNRSVEDVLREEIANYIAGKIPHVDLDGAMSTIKSTAYQAGFMLGRLRRFAREFADDE